MYRKVFNEQFNLSFHLPSKDTCEKCDGFKASLITANNEERTTVEEKKEQQLLKAVIAYEQKRKDKAYAASSENCVTASFDWQKILQCPHLQTGIVYYKRQLAVYNLTVYETTKLRDNLGHCWKRCLRNWVMLMETDRRFASKYYRCTFV